MKVKDLIELLKHYDENLPVVFPNYDVSVNISITYVEERDAKTSPYTTERCVVLE